MSIVQEVTVKHSTTTINLKNFISKIFLNISFLKNLSDSSGCTARLIDKPFVQMSAKISIK
ncbi:hypothetical protein FM107_10940 [Sphingobacterium sp. JB170]|nr:hypothetical protein FM107_10940 [Sphingobacterium sp. JB170]